MNHRISRFAPLGWVGPLAFVATGALVAQPVSAGLLGISEQDEIKAGQQVARQAEQQYGRALPDNDARQRRVRAIGRRFAALSGRKNIPYSYTVLQNDKVLNAFAAPGGPIFVTTKLVSTAANDAELAYVIGHETGHIDRKHIVNAVEKQQKQAIGIGILGTILGGGRTVSTIGGLINVGLSQKYSRNDERDADDWGVRNMAKLGYDPRAAVTMLGKLGSGEQGGLSKYLASHPSPGSRQERVRDLIQKENLLQVAQRSGGARLSDAGGYSNASYGDDVFPDEPSNVQPTTSSLGGPIRAATASGRSILLAPVVGYARWAGASIEPNEDRGTLRIERDGNSIELREGSPFADINGRSTVMATAARVYDGRLYAPVGHLADGTGTRAQVDGNRLVLSGGRGGNLSVELPS